MMRSSAVEMYLAVIGRVIKACLTIELGGNAVYPPPLKISLRIFDDLRIESGEG